MTGRNCASVVAALLCTTAAVRAGHAETISLTEALRRAKSHADVRLATATVDVRRGQATQAAAILFNPELSAGLGPRFGGGSTMLDFEVGVGQTFELGGKRRYRAAAARKRVAAARAGAAATGQLVALRVRRTFALALVARARADAAAEGLKVAAELLRTATQRQSHGVGTQLEVNLAAASVGKARQESAAASQQYIQVTVALASAVGAQATTRLEPEPGPLVSGALSVSEQALVSRALATRGELKVLRALGDVAAAETKLADSLAIPDMGIGVIYAREEGAHQALLSISIGLPLWNRNRGGRQAARARQRRVATRATYQRKEVARQVRAAYARHQAAQATIAAFQKQTVGNLRNNLQLTQAAFLKGKISIIDFNLLRRQFVDVRLAYLTAVEEGIAARYALESAIGGGLK